MITDMYAPLPAPPTNKSIVSLFIYFYSNFYLSLGLSNDDNTSTGNTFFFQINVQSFHIQFLNSLWTYQGYP